MRIKELEGLLAQRDAEIARLNAIIVELRARVTELEDLLIRARSEVREIHVAPAPPKEEMRWYYAVQDPQHAHLFQTHPRYLGGEIMVDALEGATVVNPEYYTQSENVPGNARLRVRIVEAQNVSGAGSGVELFVRLRLGSATQFTHPRPSAMPAVSWQQDFVFVGVPLKPHPFHARFQSSNYPLIVEIVARQIGTSGEQVIGTGEVDLTDLVAGLTRVIFINLNGGGSLNLRLKALDFGLPAGGVEPSQGPIMTETVRTTDTTIHVQSSKSGQTQHFSEGVMAADFGGVLE